MTKFDRESMKKRYHEADVERDALMEKLKPIHARYKDVTARLQALEVEAKAIGDEMRPIRNELAELENERGAIARYLKDSDGKTRLGERAAYVTPAEIDQIKTRALGAGEPAS